MLEPIPCAIKNFSKLLAKQPCKRSLSAFTNLNFSLVKKIRKMTKNAKKIATIWAKKTPKNDLLTLNYGLPSSFTTPST